MDWAYTTYGPDCKCIQTFGTGLRYRFGDAGIDGKIILEWTVKKYGFEWIHLAQDRVQ
jgi:hypothetical protein